MKGRIAGFGCTNDGLGPAVWERKPILKPGLGAWRADASGVARARPASEQALDAVSIGGR